MMASSLEGNFSLTGCFSFLFIPFVRLVLIILRAKCAFKFSVLYTGKILKQNYIYLWTIYLSNFKLNLSENVAFIPLHLADNLLTTFPLKICLNELHLY